MVSIVLPQFSSGPSPSASHVPSLSKGLHPARADQ